MNESPNLLVWTLGALALLLLAGGGWWMWKRRRPVPGDPEQRRRQKVNDVGRIVEGRILDLIDPPAETAGSGRLLVYRYEVRGVEYQAAQDISFYQQELDLRRIAADQSTAVKYDPQNPTNSIILCEDWSGV